MELYIKRLRPTARMPERASRGAAGYDLFADIEEPLAIGPHRSVVVPTGVAMSIPEGYFGGIFARSGLAAREMLRPGNCVGVIDEDYRGEIGCLLHNDGETERTVVPGEKIAQMIFIRYACFDFVETEELDETARGSGGFGSTGR